MIGMRILDVALGQRWILGGQLVGRWNRVDNAAVRVLAARQDLRPPVHRATAIDYTLTRPLLLAVTFVSRLHQRTTCQSNKAPYESLYSILSHHRD